jgi:xylulokinase
MYTAAFDLGTTAVKGVLVSDTKEVVFQTALPVETFFAADGFKEQDPRDWYHGFCEISRMIFARGFDPRDIRGIIMSGQMQDLIPVDDEGEPVRNAILYSDGRAGKEAEELNASLGEERIYRITGNAIDGSIPAAKLCWFRRHEPEHYNRTAKILGSSKDYVILKLCGRSVADLTAAATCGLMDIHAKVWDAAMLEAVGISETLLPELFCCKDRVGSVRENASRDSGFRPETPVYAGSGDAGASTLSSGITGPGEFNIYLGTSGWIAAVSSDTLARPGVFNLAAIPSGSYINVVPFLNAGGVHKWISGILWSDALNVGMYDYTDELLKGSIPGSRGLLFLPYLSGERFPVMDAGARGAYIGLNNETTKADMARSCLEGVAFSIRQGLEAISPENPKKVSLIGGGAKTLCWRQILADVLQCPVTVPDDRSEYLPSIALAASVFIDQGLEADYDSFIASLGAGEGLVYYPMYNSISLMNKNYMRYQNIYPRIMDFFE